MALYLADDGVTPVTTQSMIKAFRQCPREAYYKYVLRLKPKVRSLQLTRGKWMHSLLEAYYKEKSGIKTLPWREVHDQLASDFRKLFDEEKEKLGDLLFDGPKPLLKRRDKIVKHFDELIAKYGEAGVYVP